jgi:ABC-type phosphate transport system substrate-binding protein
MKVLLNIVFCLLFSSLCSFAQVAVIANKDVPVDTLSKSELLDLYTLEIGLWNTGQTVTVFDLKQKSEVKDTFYDYLDKSTSRMKSIWMKKMLSRGDDPPQSLESEESVLKKVSSTSGSIGFISKSKVSEDVKILIEIEMKS